MISSYKLPFIFDPDPLKTEIERIPVDNWTAHFNSGYYEGDWSGVALRSAGGVANQLFPDPNARGIEDTPILNRCPSLTRVLDTFQCDIRSARLLKLAPGARIKEHRDYDVGFESGEIRLHIPITTNADVEFFLEGNKVEMNPGECWYLDFSLAHKAKNGGSTDRVHLVLDCVVNDWLRALFPIEAVSSSPTQNETANEIKTSPLEWEGFRDFVLSNPPIQVRLRETDDRQGFIKLMLAIAQENGYHFLASDVEEAIRSARRAWLERWVE